jgi:GNAT superfamily N-acetyltransferase
MHATEEGAHLRWFITAPTARGCGLGNALLRNALDFCALRNYRRVYLWTFQGLDAARHLYEKFGFGLVHESRGSQWGTEVTEQRFELRT